MRKAVVTVALVTGLVLMAYSLAQAQPKAKAEVTKVEPKKEAPASQPAAKTEPVEPKDLGEAIESGKDAVTAAQAGQWWYFSSVVCLIVMFILKATKVLAKVGRWKYIILPVLSLSAALLAAFQGGVGWASAVGVFGSSWAMGSLEELVNHGILNKPRATPG